MRRAFPVPAYQTLAAAVAAGLALSALAAGTAAAPTRSLEYPVKATYLYKFAAFVDWPAAAFDGPRTPVRVCVQGDDPFGSTLDQAVRGQSIDARPVSVVRLDAVDRNSGCHVLYAGGSSRQSAAEAVAAVRGAPVLTVTDERVGDARGVVHFVIREDRVRFLIDARAASSNGLPISSKLLSLAVSVRR